MPRTPPPTETRDVVETLHGEEIHDPYRWLEGDGEDVSAWVSAQNEYAESFLHGETRNDLEPRFRALSNSAAYFPVVPTPSGYFQRYTPADEDLPLLTVRDDLDGERRVLADPNEWSDDATLTLDWFVPSPDGSLVTYGVTEGGTEQYDVCVVDAKTGDTVDELRETGRTGERSFAWTDGGFYYGRTGALEDGGQLDKSLAYHRLDGGGEDDADDELPIELDEQTWAGLHNDPDSDYLVVELTRGWERTDVYAERNGEFEPLVTGEDAIFEPHLRGSRVFFLTSLDAPNYRIVAAELADAAGGGAPETFESVVPERDDAILRDFVLAGDHIVAHYERDAVSELVAFDLDGASVEDASLPELGSIDEGSLHGSTDEDECFFRYQSFDHPPTVYRYAVGEGVTKLDAPEVPVEADLQVERERYESADGTEVPLFVVHAGVEPDGDNPTLLYGYGGFELSQTPAFRRYAVPFLKRGGVFVVANVRGGGEFGEEWHHAARKEHKQNTFDDFIAAAEHLVERDYTSPERLAIDGRSNGGLTVGASITQRPDLFAACLCIVPLLDMLRFHRFLLGASWTAEYGSPDDPEAFEYIREYSPYHNVEEREYPAVLFKTAEGDTRVHPAHARKMTARMQAKHTGNAPILLREERDTGHGVGKPTEMVVREKLDEWTFVFEQLGVE
ncbi:prolyl oligopeptidase [Haladaptatus sp. W1]|uniref:prolyl oligopeptidase family serine peptidase n=1 Tax=Haladaptatus sp. W1 TaxID=1897478 RepID=UPI00084997B4|nr:prolyl oligopeptidase family serine peptidase [Haladaptatus sp. W1]ODR82744.1 prolyl oligopeptidase [Haladaptatus sp. W1]